MPMSPRLLRPIANNLDPDAAVYLNAVAVADGQQLEPAVRKAINDFVVGCKRDNIWTAIKASCILAGARTLSGALVPLVGSAPTNNGPFVTGDYNRKTGLVGNGSSKYLDTSRANNADPQNDHNHSIYLFSTSTLSTRAFIGAGGGVAGSTSFGSAGLLPGGFVRSRSTGSAVVTLGNGFNGSSRNSLSTASFRGAGSTASISQSSSGNAAGNTFVFARENGSGVAEAYTDARLSFYSIGSFLDLALLDTRVSALVTAIGAAI